jgi:glycerol uptake facilitator-like aquaporin
MKKYSKYDLKEAHGTDIDFSPVKVHGHHTEIHIADDTHHDEHHYISKNVPLSASPRKEKIKPYNYNDLWKVFLVELTACIIFMLIENYSQGNLQTAIFGLFVLLTILYPVSGANMNACVSLALWYYEEEFNKIHTIRRYTYMFLIQPVGIFVGQMLSWGVIGPNLIYLKPKDADPIRIAFCEFFWSGVVIFGALHFIVSKHTRPSNQLSINFIAFLVVLYFCISAGFISGGSYNPTKYLVNQAIAYHRGIELNAFKNWYCYIFPQFIGTMAFTCAFKYFFEPLYYRLLTLKGKWEDSFFPEKYD